MSNAFPVTSSILSAGHIAGFLADAYGLPKNVECRVIKCGLNHTYSVLSAAGNYVFRIYCRNWRIEEEILEEIRLLETLKDRGIPISDPIPDRQGKFIQKFQAPEGERMAVLFSYAEGEKLQNYPAELHYRIGKLMAELHLVTENITLNRISYTPEILLEWPLKELSNFLPKHTEEWKLMQSLGQEMLLRLQNINEAELRYGAVHLDIWFDNLNIAGEKVTLFDFDNAGNGWLVIDVAYYLIQIFNVEREPDAGKEKSDAFLAGYESVTKLTEEEKRLLPDLGLAIYFYYLGVQCYRFDDWTNSFISEMYLKRYITAVIKRYADMLDG